jgi:hypothetical protein
MGAIRISATFASWTSLASWATGYRTADQAEKEAILAAGR